MKIASFKCQGRRKYMEDELICKNNQRYCVTGIFDGHGGGNCSKFLETFFYPLFMHFINTRRTVEQSLYYTIIKIHSYILKNQYTTSGSTCNVLVIDKKEKKFYLANIGDSRAIMSLKNGNIYQISEDHKPNKLKEKELIYKKGGFVQNNRVNGILSMSRAIGDSKIAKVLSPIPDIYRGSLKNFDFIIQTSDGLLDVMTNKMICHVVRVALRHNIPSKDVLKGLINGALENKRCRDNMSVILITAK